MAYLVFSYKTGLGTVSYGPYPATLARVISNPDAFRLTASDSFGWSLATSGSYYAVGMPATSNKSGAYLMNATTDEMIHFFPYPGTETVNPEFGFRVSVTDSRIAIATARYLDESVNQVKASGTVYVYDLETFNLIATITNPNPYGTDQFDQFAHSMTMTGNYLVVGANGEDGAGGEFYAGRVYVFNATTGELIRTMSSPNGDQNFINYGLSLCSYGNYIGVSEPNAGSGFKGVHIYDVTTGALVRTILTDCIADPPNPHNVAMDANYLVVGSYGSTAATEKVYIYNVNTGALLHTLTNPNTYGGTERDGFGTAVALNGSYVVVGASDEIGPSGEIRSGIAYVYDTSTGNLLWTLHNPNSYGTPEADDFAFSVGMVGNKIIIGARGEDSLTGTDSGIVYTFDSTTGLMSNTVANPAFMVSSANENFGYGLAITDTLVVSGAPNEGDSSGSSSGKAYVFNKLTGELLHTFDNPSVYGTGANDTFGINIAASNSYIVIASTGETDVSGTASMSGVVYVYNASTYALLHTFTNPNAYGTPTGDDFGAALGLAGDYLVVGSPGEDDAGGADAGKAYIFDLSTGALLHTLDDPNAYGTSASDRFGSSIAASGTKTVIGACYESDEKGTYAGKAYIFDLSTGALLHTLDDPNLTTTQDVFSLSVSMDGNYVVVGAPGAPNTSFNGMVFVFDANTGTLLRVIDDPNPDTVPTDYFSYSLSMSGYYVLIGAVLESSVGKAYVFNVATGELVKTFDNPSSDSMFATRVAMKGPYAVIGHPNRSSPSGDQNFGTIYVYTP